MNDDERGSGRPSLSVVDGTPGFDEITGMLVRDAIRLIERYKIANPKMATRLLQELALRVERHYEKPAHDYITKRITEQIDRYIALGFAEFAGYSEATFRAELAPLVARVHRFFAPPALHPIQDGEFTLLLVIPTELVPLRRQVVTLRAQSGHGVELPESLDDLLKRARPERTKYGKVSPKQPYVLVGINGGRGLKENMLGFADQEIEKFGQTYFSIHEFVQLLLVRPKFLEQGEAIPLGEKCADGYLRFQKRGGTTDIDVTQIRDDRYGIGVGKPYYTRMIV